MIDLNKYIVSADPGSVMHSSGYAEVANAGRIGSVGSTSFDERKRIEQVRQSVGSYNRSIIGQAYGVQRAKSVAPGSGERTSLRPRSSMGPTAASSSSFSEPSGRSYNPYA